MHGNVVGEVPVEEVSERDGYWWYWWRRGAVTRDVIVLELGGNLPLEVRRILTERRLPLRLLDPILTAYDQEPHPSVFGIAQAMTRAGQEATPEERGEIERIAREVVVAAAA